MTRKITIVALSVLVLFVGAPLLYSWRARAGERREQLEEFRRKAFCAPEVLRDVLNQPHPEPVLKHLAFFASLESREQELADALKRAHGGASDLHEGAMGRLYDRLAGLMPAAEPVGSGTIWRDLFPRTTTLGYKADTPHALKLQARGTAGIGALQLTGDVDEPRVELSVQVTPATVKAVYLEPFDICSIVEGIKGHGLRGVVPLLARGHCEGGLATERRALRCRLSGRALNREHSRMRPEVLPFRAEGHVIELDSLETSARRRLCLHVRGSLVRRLRPFAEGTEPLNYLVLGRTGVGGLQGLLSDCRRLWEVHALDRGHLADTGCEGLAQVLARPFLAWNVDNDGYLPESAPSAYETKAQLVEAFSDWIDRYEDRLN